jgi:hypothetical protein
MVRRRSTVRFRKGAPGKDVISNSPKNFGSHSGSQVTQASGKSSAGAWAPPWTSDELRHARAGVRDSRLAALRAAVEAEAARRHGQHDEAARQQTLATSYQAMHDTYREREAALAVNMADRADWEQATSDSWPWPPTPNSAAATPPSPGPRYAPPNPLCPTTTTPKPPRPRTPKRLASGSATWLPITANSPTNWPNGRAE